MRTFPISLHLVGSLLFVVACGGGSAAPDAGADAPSAIDAAPATPHAIVVAGDFTAGDPGVLSRLDLASLTMTTNAGPAMAVGDDPLLRHYGNALYVINRSDGNNITILDATTLQLLEQIGTGAGTGPQDVAVNGNTIYVPTASGKGVLVLTRGSTTHTEIDLSADDPDGKPNCESAYIVGSQLYVACGLLDDTQLYLPPRGLGKVYQVDLATGTVLHSITLTTKNPFGSFEQIPAGAPHAGDLVLQTLFFDDGSGCVERITTTGTPTAAGCVVDNTTLGGYPTRIDFQSRSDATVMWMGVSSSDYVHANLQAFILDTSTLLGFPVTPPTQKLLDSAVCPDGEVVASDSTMNAAGLRVYRDYAELTAGPLAVGLTPSATHGLVCY